MARAYSSILRGASIVALHLVGCAQEPPTVQTSAQAVSMGAAQSFAVLAGSTVTNTGPTTVVGDLGVSPGLAVTGFPPGVVTGGVIHTGDAVALQAQQDTTTAYNDLAGRACNNDLTGQDLGGLTLTPGVYCFSSSAQLTGTLTLDAQGDPGAEFIFQVGSTLTTASSAAVRVINGAQTCNVLWQVGSSATLGTTTAFVGDLLALASITLNTGATVIGRALARNGAVTMDTNRVAPGACVGASDAGADVVDSGAADADVVDSGALDAPRDTGAPDARLDAPRDTAVLDARRDTAVLDAPRDTGAADARRDTAVLDAPRDTGAVDARRDTGVADAPRDTGAADTPRDRCNGCCPGTVACGATCVDLTSDPRNCGACGRACLPSETCGSSACGVCIAVCDGECSNPENDSYNCGACGIECAQGTACTGGACVPCETLCNGYCTDLPTNASHCGACGQACAAGDDCVNGVCTAPCPPPRLTP